MTATFSTRQRRLLRLCLPHLCLAAAVLGMVAPAGAGAGAQELTSVGGFDTDQPIEINADSLEVQQDNNLAVFSGNVVAAQGAMRLKAQTLKVYYRRSEGSATQGEATISRIDAIGGVFLTSPNETAQGEVGVYDVENGVVTLSGSVVLTRGDNVIRGERLVLDLTTGRSRVDGVGADGQRKRVRALFVPPKKSPQQ
ncbi:MAG: lipopolysaccharide transport periplasmic protein LptA [Alphaproteobacteria bacterium]